MTLSRRLRKSFRWLLTPAAALVLLQSTQGIAHLVGANLPLDLRSLAIDASFARRSAARGPPPFHATSAAAILARNPFDSVTGPLDRASRHESPEDGAADDDPVDAPPCEGVLVHAIVTSADPEWSLATLEEGSPPRALLRRRGGDVGVFHVEFIAWDRVWMDSPKGLCQASMFAPRVASPRTIAVAQTVVSQAASPVDPWILKGIETVSPTEHNIDRGLLPRLIEKQAELLGPARGLPELANGKIVGYRVNGVRPGSLLDVLGVANGDLLRSINGHDLTNIQAAIDAYTQLQQAEKLVLQVTRGGSELRLELNVR